MNTPVILYSASGTPIGAAGGIRALIQFNRPTAALDAAGLSYIAATGPASAAGSNPVGSPIAISELSLELSGKDMTTTGRYGENNDDPTIVREGPKLNCGTFVQAAGQPLICPGDYTDLAIGTKITSTAGTPVVCPLSRWVVGANSLSTSGANKWSLKLILDRVNSDPSLKEF